MEAKKFLRATTISAWVAALSIGWTSAAGADNSANEPQITERTIKIEGTVEKPRVLFIVPRARIWKDYSFHKSFYEDILTPVYPEGFMKESINSDRDKRR